jgi:hypothetical protein
MVALGGLWGAAALTFYTGYAYFRAGLIHTRGERATHGKNARTSQAAPAQTQRRTA